MTQEGFKRKLTAILSADVEGYSRLMGEDEEATVRTLTTYREVLTTLIQQHNGKVLDSPGDNLLAEFTSVVDAVQCAVAVQKELQARNEELPENRRMEFRIGINFGDVIDEEGHIYGDGVNIAARLEAMADPGGICVSKTAFDHIESKLPLGYEYLGEQEVKNIPRPVSAYRVILSEDDNEMITLADEREEFESVEEFLESIYLEEDSLPEEQEEEDENEEIENEIIQFDDLNADIEDVELEDFINDSLNEEIRIDDDLENDVTSSLGIEAGSEMNMIDQASEAEDLDFNIDSREISAKIDQLGTIFFNETESETEFVDETASETAAEGEDENKWVTDDDKPEEPTQNIDTTNLTADQIEGSIERVIRQNFSEEIESMVVEMLKKAVSKEIDQLKNILLEDNSNDRS